MVSSDALTAAYGTFHGAPATSRSSRSRLARVVALAALAVAIGSVLFAAQWPRFSPTATLSASESPALTAAQAEAVFLAGIDREKLRQHLHAYASKPHSAGTAQDYETALYTKQQFENLGIKAEIIPYYPLLSRPVHQRVAITAPASRAQELNLTEGSIEGDACTTDKDALPPFLAFTATGNVTASIVYAHYGRQSDFEWLVAQGVELKGKIALVRYGINMRGLKVMLAERFGMVATLIYSDPSDDGEGVGPTYPNGPWRPKNSFQRGSAQYMSLYTGDPLTPGFASTKNASYLKIEDLEDIPRTPATVLSYEQATLIFQSLGGTPAPADWHGGLALEKGYFLGDDGATQVNVDLKMDNSIGTIWDVVGTIDGVSEPDQLVILGHHRDSWVCGAVDPSSGSSTLLEIARGLSELRKKGWQPRRTIKLASWDGEEYSLTGSTEYAEDNKQELLQNAVAYINVDSVSGPFVSAAGTPSIAEFLYETAKSVPANQFYGNETEATLYDQWKAQLAAQRRADPSIDKGTLAPEHLIKFLGSGTDFTPFYQHLGIISADITFTISPVHKFGAYHSSMDSPMLVEKYLDPHFTTQATTARWWGLLAIRLATVLILPFDFSTYGVVMHTDLSNLEVQTKALKLAIDYSRLRQAIDHFITTSTAFRAATDASGDGKTTLNVTALNDKLVHLERQFLSEDGLQHRPWYRHVIFGPGFYEGYAGAAFPGIADGIAFHDNATTIQAHVDAVTKIVTQAGDYLAN
jgi:N-acetylated-alpha-linked acidic dipeptidase